MLRTPVVPDALKSGPFTVREAAAAGVSMRQLQGKSWLRLAQNLYVWREVAGEPATALAAAVARVSPPAVFSGFTAAWLHGITADFRPVVEVTVPDGFGVSIRTGMVVLRRYLEADDVVDLRGYRVTSICRTLRDLSWRLSVTEAVVMVDAALQAGLVDLAYLKTWMVLRRGTGGIARLRRAVEHAEPLAESPMESRLRMVLVLRGLPRPEAQVSIADGAGRFAGRLDLYYRDRRLGIEYDGATHEDSLAADDQRQNRLLGAGIRLLRFTATDLQHPDEVAAQVAHHLQFNALAS